MSETDMLPPEKLVEESWVFLKVYSDLTWLDLGMLFIWVTLSTLILKEKSLK